MKKRFFDNFCGKWLFCCISKASAARKAPLHRHLRNAFFLIPQKLSNYLLIFIKNNTYIVKSLNNESTPKSQNREKNINFIKNLIL